MNTTFLKNALIMVVGLSIGSISYARTRTVSNGFRLENRSTETVYLEYPSYVESIRVSAEGIRWAGMFEVWANGKIKGSIYVPGNDPCYVVTIRETIRSIEFRSISNSDIRINSVVVQEREGSYFGHHSIADAVSLAQKTIELINAVKPSADLHQLSEYLMPIRKAASRLYAVATINSAYDSKTHAALVNLQSSIVRALPYLEQQLETDSTYELATGLLEVKEELDNMTR